MIRAIQQRSKGQRQAIFFFLVVTGLLVLLIPSVLLGLSFLSPSNESVALVEGVTVSEFATLPDDDAYPPAIAVAPDGTLFTGSFVSGAIWQIDANGRVTEVDGTRLNIGSVMGLEVAPDGVLYIVDQLDSNPGVGGGVVKRLSDDGRIDIVARIDDGRGFEAPDDIAIDSAGNLYVSDRARQEVWRFEANGNGELWWTPPRFSDRENNHEPTGLAYDAVHDAIIITDPVMNAIYRVSIATGESEILYLHAINAGQPPGFDGVTVTPDGEIYVAALEQNGVARLEDGQLHYIAGLFRGSSDVEYFADKLYVTNFDQFSLVLTVSQPRLPFAIDVIDLNPSEG